MTNVISFQGAVITDRRLRGTRRRLEGNPYTPREWALWLLDRWSDFARTPEPLLMDAGAAGEHLVARVRLWLAGLVFLIPAIDRLARPAEREVTIGLSFAAVGFLLALLAYRITRRKLYRPWIGFATGLLDVTLVSLALVSFLLIDQPHTTLNSRVVFPIYLLAIAASALRFDPRICAVTGLGAMGQYLAVVLVTVATHPQLASAPDAVAYGQFEWSDQISRLMLLAIAAILSISIVMRTRRLQWLSARDRLTDVINRSAFDDLLAREAERAHRGGTELVVLLVDLDRFGLFNETYGVVAGDRTLRLVAGTIRQVTGRRGLVARYGGDAFAVLVEETKSDGVVHLAEQIRAAAAATPTHPTRMSVPEPLTVSIGIAAMPADGVDPREMCATAERRLAEAKRAGGNRVAAAEPAVRP
ncbi:MAG TPA: GGDEF domain-containing protein [Gemmatimonadales bacterium]|nr:GGDEF domain-containing protein [Gemmatimonadales bacterium]